MEHTLKEKFPFLLTDEPINNHKYDGLEINSLARIVADVARGTKGPFTVGIFGGWGVGKTSVLQLSKAYIDKEGYKGGDQQIITVLFNAWQYDKESMPLIPLVSVILSEIKKTSKPAKKVVKNFKDIATALRSILLCLSADIKGGVPGFGDINIGFDFPNAFDRYNKLRSKWIDQQIEKSVSYNALKSLESVRKDSCKIVVFIDDLDRCLPDKALELLESIKLILFHPCFIFILAMDKEILESYLDMRYRKEFGLKKYQQGQSYLDKLIQLPLWIPQHNERFNVLIAKLLGQEAPVNSYYKKFVDQFDQKKEVLESHHETLGLACQFNPRQLVRILNHLLIDKKIYSVNSKNEDFPLEAFMVARGLRHHNEKIYKFFLNNFDICNKIYQCSGLECLQNLLAKQASDQNLDMEERKLLPKILERVYICRLLLTEPGKKWLQYEKLKKKRIDRFIFEKTEFLKGSEHRLYRERQIQIAIEQLYSPNEDDIMAGCNKLFVFGNPVSSKVTTKLRELLKHEDPNVIREAKNTLFKLVPDVVC